MDPNLAKKKRRREMWAEAGRRWRLVPRDERAKMIVVDKRFGPGVPITHNELRAIRRTEALRKAVEAARAREDKA